MLGDLEKAMLLFDEVMKLDPGNHAARYEKAGIYLERREFAKAIESANAAIAGDQQNYWYYRKLEEIFTDQGNYEKAIETAENIIDQFPPAYDDHARLADLAERSQLFEKAVKHYKQAAKRPSGNIAAMVNAARLEREQGKKADALQTTKELMEMAPSDARGYEMHMQLLTEMGREDEAKTMVNQWIKADPANGQAKLLLAGFADSEKALDLLADAFLDEKTALDPKLAALDKAISNFGDNNTTDLIALINMLKQAHGNQAEIDARAGRLYLQSERYSEAATVIREGLRTHPANERAWEDLLFADLAASDYDALKRDVEESLELYPNNKSLLAWYAIWGQKVDDQETTDYALSKIMKTGPGESEAELTAFFNWSQRSDLDMPPAVAGYFTKMEQAIEQTKNASPDVHSSGEVLKHFKTLVSVNRLMNFNPEFLTYYGHAAKKAGNEKLAEDLWKKAKQYGAISPENAL
jgi:tetratricopeptide (TPR) repeat protein